MNFFITWLKNSSYAPSSWDDTEEINGSQTRKAVIDLLTFVAIVASIIYVGINYFQGNYAMIITDLVVVFLCILVFILNFFGSFEISRGYFLLLANSAIFLITLFNPANNGYFVYFFPILIATFIIFDAREVKGLLSFVGFNLFLSAASFFVLFYHKGVLPPGTEWYSAINIAINFIIAFVASGAVLVYWKIFSRSLATAYQNETARMKALIENTNEGVWLIDKKFNIISFNQVFVHFCHAAYGKTPRRGMSLYDLSEEAEEKELWFSVYEKALEGEKFTTEFHYDRNGFNHYYRLSVNPILNAEAEVRGIACYAKDVTLRLKENEAIQLQKKQLQGMAKQLVESEKRYELAILGSNSGIWDWDLQTNQVFHSPIWEEMLGYSGAELPEMDIHFMWSLIHPDDREKAKNGMIAHIHSGAPYREEFRLRRKDGQYRWFVDTGKSQLNEKGDAVRMVGSIIDITQRIEAEQSNRANSQLLSMVLDNLPVTICRLDRSGNILELAGSVLSRLQLSSEEFIGMPYQTFNPAFKSEFLTQLKEEGIFRFESSVNVGNLELFFENAIFMEDEQRYIGFSMDVTSMHRFQQELLEQNQMLEKTNQELDRFVYSASHDLRAPLKSILGLIKIATIDTQDQLQHEYLQMINKSVEKLETFIEEIIEYSRNSRLELRPEKVDFQKLVESSMENLQFMDGAKRIKVSVDVEASLDFHSDVSRIQTMLNNLLSNAVKYHDFDKETPFIKVEVRSITSDKTVQFSIADNGKGIAAEYQSRIFEMFYRATEESSGSGLGLYIVKEITDKLKGQLSFESEEGKGTLFKIILPDLKEILSE